MDGSRPTSSPELNGTMMPKGPEAAGSVPATFTPDTAAPTLVDSLDTRDSTSTVDTLVSSIPATPIGPESAPGTPSLVTPEATAAGTAPSDGSTPAVDGDVTTPDGTTRTVDAITGPDGTSRTVDGTTTTPDGTRTVDVVPVSGEVITPAQEREALQKKPSLTPSERQRLNELNSKSEGETRHAELDRMQREGKVLTPDQLDELNRLDVENPAGPVEAKPELSPKEKLDKEVEDMGTDLMMEMARTEPRNAVEQAALRGKVDAFKAKWLEMQSLNSGFTEEQAREAVKAAMNVEVNGGVKNEKAMALEKEVQEKMLKMRAIELRIMAIPKDIDALEQQEEKIKKSISKIGPPGVNDSPFTIAERQKNYTKYNQLAQVQSRIESVETEEDLLGLEYRDTMQEVRSKLGVTRFWGAMGEFIVAKGSRLMIEGKIRSPRNSYINLAA